MKTFLLLTIVSMIFVAVGIVRSQRRGDAWWWAMLFFSTIAACTLALISVLCLGSMIGVPNP